MAFEIIKLTYLLTYLLTYTIVRIVIYLNFASSDSKVSKKTVETTTLQTTQVTEGNKSTYTAPIPKTCTILTISENAEINIIQIPFESSKGSEINS